MSVARPGFHSGLIFVDVGGPVNTGVVMANLTEVPMNIGFVFTDASGQNVGAGGFVLAPLTRVAKFVTEAPFNLTRPLRGTMSFSGGPPVNAAAIRTFVNERSEFLISNSPLIDFGQGENLPHFADGAGWTTEIVLVNRFDEPISGAILFLDDGTENGVGLPVQVTVDGKSGPSFNFAIPPRGVQTFRTSGDGSDVQVGSVYISTPSGPPAAGLLIFSLRSGGATVTETIAMSPSRTTLLRMFVEEGGNFPGEIQTGIAIQNPSVEGIAVSLQLSDENGLPTGRSATVNIPPLGDFAGFLREIPEFASLPHPFKGNLLIVTLFRVGAAVMGLRGHYNERSDFLLTAVPTVPVHFPLPVGSPVQSAPPIGFPHIVNGGGYTTELVLFSSLVSGAGTTESVNFHFIPQPGDSIDFDPSLQE